MKDIDHSEPTDHQQQMEEDAVISKIWTEHLLVSVLSIGAIPFVFAVNKEWGALLIETIFGNVVLAFNALSVLASLVYAAFITNSLRAGMTLLRDESMTQALDKLAKRLERAKYVMLAGAGATLVTPLILSMTLNVGNMLK